MTFLLYAENESGKNMKFSLLLFVVLIAGCMDYQLLSVSNGRLKDCPKYPNCVNSQTVESDIVHFIQPISYIGEKEIALKKMKQTILSFDRTEILKTDSAYIHATFTSKIFRFVDDVEFYADDTAKVFHVRSASRLGMGDHGVNRERIESIRKAFEKK